MNNNSTLPATNQCHAYVTQLVGHFKDSSPITYRVLAERGQVFPHRAASQPVLGELGECYVNAYYLAHNQGLYYVEGLAIVPSIGFPMEHAWCVDADGHVYDPTWEAGTDYFGVAFTPEGQAGIYDQTGYHSIFGNLMYLRGMSVEQVYQLLLDASLPIRIEAIEQD